MRIAILHPRLSYYTGGGEKYPLDAVMYMSRLLPDTFFDVYTTQTRLPESHSFTYFKSQIDANRVRVIEMPIPTKFEYVYDIEPGEIRFRWDVESLFFNSLAYEKLLEDKPDLIWSYYLLDCLSKPQNIPSVLHLLGYPRKPSENREACLAQYDHIASISINVLNKWNELMSIPIKTDSILHQGVDVSGNSTTLPFFNKKSFNIVFAGRIIERKGIITLLEALRTLLPIVQQDVQVYIVGDGSFMSTVRTAVAEMGLDSHVHIEGHKDNVKDYFASADLCVFPSHEGEGLMSTVLEAMYYNGLVLTTYENGNEEAIEDGVNGFIVQPKSAEKLSDKILEIIQGGQDIEVVRQKAKETIRNHFSWESHAEVFTAICKKALEGK